MEFVIAAQKNHNFKIRMAQKRRKIRARWKTGCLAKTNIKRLNNFPGPPT